MSSTFEKLFQEKLSILNNNFVRFLQESLRANPSADCSPTVKDYLNYVNNLDTMYGKASVEDAFPPSNNFSTAPAIISSFTSNCSTPLRTTASSGTVAPLLFGQSSPLKTATEQQITKKVETTAAKMASIPSFLNSSTPEPTTTKSPEFGEDVIKSSTAVLPPGFSVANVPNRTAKPKFGGEVIKSGSSLLTPPTGFLFGEPAQKKEDVKNDFFTQNSTSNKTETSKQAAAGAPKELLPVSTIQSKTTFGGFSTSPTCTASPFASFGAKTSAPTFEDAWKHYKDTSTPLGSSSNFSATANNESDSFSTIKTTNTSLTLSASNRKRRNKDQDPWFSSQKRDNTREGSQEKEVENVNEKQKEQLESAVTQAACLDDSFSTTSKTPSAKPSFLFGANNLLAASKPATTIATSTTSIFSSPSSSSSLFSMSAKSAPTFSFAGAAAKPIETNLTFGATSVALKIGDNANSKEDDQEEEQDEPPKPESVNQSEKDAIVSLKCGVHNFANGKYEKKGIGYASIKALDGGKKQLIIRHDTTLGTIWTNIVVNANLKWQMSPDKRLKITYPELSQDGKSMGGVTTLLLRFSTENERQQLIDQFTANGSTNKP